MPFLRIVTGGRGIPDERLAEVAEHYQHFGGISPINEQNRALLGALQGEFVARGIELPAYWGNRNWHPFLADTVRTMRADGVRRALVLATSAAGGYSGCRQYREDLAAARARVGPGAPELVKLRHFFNHPGFIEANADRLRTALAEVAQPDQRTARLVFTAHSIPDAADAVAGPSGRLYSRQQFETARLVATAVRGADAEFDLVWQSRSGPPRVPWLGPDVNDHLVALAGRGVQAAVLCPTGFVSDHIEVLWDLDSEAAGTAARLGMRLLRASTAGVHPAFVGALGDLVQERLDAAPVLTLGRLGPTGVDCPVDAGCCVAVSAATTLAPG